MSKKLGMFLGAAGVILVPVITILIVMQARTPGPPQGPINEEGYRITASGLKILDENVGDGNEAVEGKNVQVHYTGKLMNGKQFDSSVGTGKPFEFQIGRSAVIKGWHEGVAGMKVGGKRKLIVPPDLGYGASGKGDIPANAKLYFEIELLKVE